MKYPLSLLILAFLLCACRSLSTDMEATTDIPLAKTQTSTATVTPTTAQAPPTDTPVPPTEAPTEPPIEFPSGKFYNGSFDSYLIINDDGTWRLLEGTSRTFFTGLYQLEGDQVTFTEWSGYCSEFGNGIYSWNFLEGVLSIKTVKDDCELRISRLTLPYTQQ